MVLIKWGVSLGAIISYTLHKLWLQKSKKDRADTAE